MDLIRQQSEPLCADDQTASQQASVGALLGAPAAEGGGTPRMVIPGESFPESGEKYEAVLVNRKARVIAHPLPKPDGVAYAAITDYLNCTFPFNPNDLPIFFSRLSGYLDEVFFPAVDRERPLHFYKHSYSLGNSSALFGYGKQGGILSFSGEACALVRNWAGLVELLRDKLGGHISRWDGAADDYEGVH